VCGINVPITYPAPEVNGIMISGLGAPGLNERAFFPRQLFTQLQNQLGPYILDVPLENYGPHDVSRFLEDLKACTTTRKRYLLDLFEREDWDLFMVVLSGTDRIQHKLWDVLYGITVGNGNGREGEISRGILEYFGMVDGIVGEIDRRLEGDDLLLMMSDHGFGSLEHEIAINRWLEQKGFFTPVRGKLALKKGIRFARGIQMRLLSRLSPSSFEKKSQRRIESTETARKPRIDFVNWRKTRAFSTTRTQQGITINLKGREPFGTVEPGEEYESLRSALIDSLRELKDPVTGGRMENLVYRREEVYSGPYVGNAPDIVYLFDGGRIIATHQYGKDLFTPVTWKTGNGMHRRQGIFIAKGKNVVAGLELPLLSIVDIAPTILYHLGVEIPDDFDGKLIEEMYRNDFRTSHEVRFERTAARTQEAEDSVYSEEDKKIIEDQLRGIGYLE
jgi:predicted AlkP superfamily phosphohydrolase/phosphomutase